MQRLLWVCLGSAVGGGARYVLAGLVQKGMGSALPWGTLAVNLIGSFLLAALMFLGTQDALFTPSLRLALTTGVMGGFTTYSTFSYETMKSLQDGAWGVAVTNVTVTVFGCLAASLLGWAAARWWLAA